MSVPEYRMLVSHAGMPPTSSLALESASIQRLQETKGEM